MIPRRENSVKRVELLKIKFGEKKYSNQFTSTGKIKIPIIHTRHAPNRYGRDIHTK